MTFHKMQISNNQYLEKVFSKISKRKLEVTENSLKIGIEALKTKLLMLIFFLSTTMKAVIRIGQNYTEILEVHKNANFEEIQILFGIT